MGMSQAIIQKTYALSAVNPGILKRASDSCARESIITEDLEAGHLMFSSIPDFHSKMRNSTHVGSLLRL